MGYKKPKDLQRRSTEFVRTNFTNVENLNPFRRRFFPSKRVLKNMITRVKQEVRSSKIDQENIEEMISTWKKIGDVVFSPK